MSNQNCLLNQKLDWYIVFSWYELENSVSLIKINDLYGS